MGTPVDAVPAPAAPEPARQERADLFPDLDAAIPPHALTDAHHPAFRWVPIRSLADRHRERIKTHLLALPPEDRYLRFGYAATDAHVGLYVDRIDFDQDAVFGIFNRRLQLVAMAHLAYLPPEHGALADGKGVAEFGVSVNRNARGRGYGARLFDHAVLHARNRQIETMVIHALSENTAMLRIARNAGAAIVRDGGDSEARLKLPPENLATIVEELVEGHAAEFDYQLKQGVRHMDTLLSLFSEVREQIERVRARKIE